MDRNTQRRDFKRLGLPVALRKESVDRNMFLVGIMITTTAVALRKESVDRNPIVPVELTTLVKSLSARRAWIEIQKQSRLQTATMVALRKESVDRNDITLAYLFGQRYVALRKESVDRNVTVWPS